MCEQALILHSSSSWPGILEKYEFTVTLNTRYHDGALYITYYNKKTNKTVVNGDSSLKSSLSNNPIKYKISTNIYRSLYEVWVWRFPVRWYIFKSAISLILTSKVFENVSTFAKQSRTVSLKEVTGYAKEIGAVSKPSCIGIHTGENQGQVKRIKGRLKSSKWNISCTIYKRNHTMVPYTNGKWSP